MSQQAGLRTELLWGGGEVLARELATSHALVPGSGGLRFTYFRPQRSEAITHIVAAVGAIPTATSVTMQKMGVFTVADDGSLTLAAYTGNDTTMFGALGEVPTAKTALNGTFQKRAGVWLAIGILQIGSGGGAAMAALSAFSYDGQMATSNARLPRQVASLGGQTDLPAGPTADNALTNQASGFWVGLLP